MNTTNVTDDREVCTVHAGTVEKAKEKAKQLDGETMVRLSDIFKALSDPTRLKIIHALSAGEMCVCGIAEVLDMEHSAISHQLRLLRNWRLVKFRKDGKMVVYSLDDNHVLELFEEGLEHARHG